MPFRPPRELKHSGTRSSWPCSAQPRVYMSPCSVSRIRWSLPVCECSECMCVCVCVCLPYVCPEHNVVEPLYEDTSTQDTLVVDMYIVRRL